MAARSSLRIWLLRFSAVLLLALTIGAVRASATEPHRKDDPLLARVNDHPLHLSDVYASIETLSLGDQIDARDQLDTYIEAMINEEVLFQWALRSDFDGDEELRREVKELVVRHLINTHVRRQIHVTEADARAYYDAHPSLVRGEHVRVRRIVLSQRSRCKQLMQQIKTDEDFIRAAKKYSLDKETRDSGGDMGLMMRGDTDKPGYREQFFDMKRGEMRIFDLPQGCMLVRSVYYVNPPLPPFSAVRDQIMQYLHNREEANLVDTLFQRAIKFSKVERYYGSKRGSGATAHLDRDRGGTSR